jgi:hypothetical protein
MSNPSPEVYEKAAEVIEQRGWYCDGSFTPDGPDIDLDTCPVCVLGAINVALGRAADSLFDPVVDAVSYEMAVAFARHLGFDVLTPDDVAYDVGDTWNDKMAGSDDVITHELREFAASLKAGA